MQVVLLCNSFGAFRGKSGDAITVPDATAAKLIAGGFAKAFIGPIPAASLETTSLRENNETTSQN